MTMYTNLEKLISISSPAISNQEPNFNNLMLEMADSMQKEFQYLFGLKNGFYAFESALHLFPAAPSEESTEITLGKWNDKALWKEEYDNELEDCLCFAEDIFGIQFCIKNNSVCTFDPETGDFEIISNSVESWAQSIMEDYEVLTGFPLAHEWQSKYGIIKPNERLLPKTPFVCGGEFSIDNICKVNSVKGMRFRAQIAKQIRNLPDGSKIKFVIEE